MGKVLPFVRHIRRSFAFTGCSHEHVSIGMFDAEITCDDCGKEVCVWEYVRALAYKSDVVHEAIATAKVEADRLRAEVAALKRERDNLKAQVKRRKVE